MTSLRLAAICLFSVLLPSHAFLVRQGTREAGAAPTHATAAVVSPTSKLIPQRPPSRLFMSTSSLQEIETMRVGELKKELESYGINTKVFLEKSELVDAIKQARADGLKPKEVKVEVEKPKEVEVETTTTTSSSSSSSSTSSSSSSKNEDKRPREERLKEELANCQALKNAELKKELTSLGISTASFFEKSEFVQALAEARVDGVKKEEEGYAEYADVEVLTAEDAGPRPKGGGQQQQQQASPFGGGGSPFGGAAGGSPFGGAAGGSPFGGAAGGSPFGGAGGAGGMGGIADMLKNMGMGGAAAGGASPFGGAAGGNPFEGGGGMGGMGGAMGKAQELMKNPKIMELMAKAQSDPKMMKIMQECMSNPAAMAKYQNDPEVAELMKELKKIM